MIPELPDIGLVERKLGWLDEYVNYASRKSPMTPTIFHESAGLWLLSVVIARRFVLKMSFADVYTNLFICWLAPTTLWHKTTGLNIARKIVNESFPHLISAQDMTPESFLSDMAGMPPANLDKLSEQDKELWKKEQDFCAQRGLVLDEMSGLMASSGRDYNAGLLESLMRFYDCEPLSERSTRGQGRVIVRDAYLTMIGASTPAAMIKHLQNEYLWSNGWWPRFALLTPSDEPAWLEAKTIDEPKSIREKLHFLYKTLPYQKWPIKKVALDVILSSDAFELWNAYNKIVQFDMIVSKVIDGKLNGTYGRSQMQALKVAMLLAACEFDGNKLIVNRQHINDGILIAESWRKSAHSILDITEETDFNKNETRIINLLYARDLTLRDLHVNMRNCTPIDIQTTLDQMEKMGLVEKFYDNHEGKGGRPAIKYRVKND
jgi:hypothetical protein